jgi:hypothetical protein
MKTEKLVRTQVLLEAAQLALLNQIAEEEGKSVSSILRELVKLALNTHLQKEIAKAAEKLHDVYYTDGELVGYSAIDHDDFLLKG